LSDVIDYRVDLNLDSTLNVDTFDVYINGSFYGSDLNKIQLNTSDTILIEVTKDIVGEVAQVDFTAKLV
jgi:hypothetical protein